MASLEEQFLDDFDSSEDEVPVNEEKKLANGVATAGDKSFSDPAITKTEEAFDNETLQKNLDEVLSLVQEYEKTPGIEREVSGNEMRDGSDKEYSFVVRCVQLIPEVDNEIAAIYQRLLRVYSIRFPELETLILNPLDYARVVIRAGNASDFAKIDLGPILPAGTVITVQVTASATAGRLLSAVEAGRAKALAEIVLHLDSQKRRILSYIESRAGFMAPNLTAILGGAVSAALMGIVGGLQELARMPSCNVKVVGKTRRPLAGASTQTVRPHEGIIFSCPLVASLPPAFRSKGGDVVAGKATLAARAMRPVHSETDLRDAPSARSSRKSSIMGRASARENTQTPSHPRR